MKVLIPAAPGPAQEEPWGSPIREAHAAATGLKDSSQKEHGGCMMELILSKSILLDPGHGQGSGAKTHLSYARASVEIGMQGRIKNSYF